MAKEIPACNKHAVCMQELTGPPSVSDVEQVLACWLERGIAEIVPGTVDTYRFTEEYRNE